MTAVRTNGSTPDRAIIWAQLQDTTPDCSGTATLSFSFNGSIVQWRNALCDKSTLEVSTHGHMQVFTIQDSRWRWAKAWITGRYNVASPGGAIVNTKSTAELIQLIFAEIGVSVDVSLVTDTENPEVDWDNDNCADMLDELLEPRGYVVSLQLDDTAKVWPRNSGSVIPANGDVVNANMAVDPPEIPLVIRAVGEKVYVQSMLKLVPVCPDTNGQVKQAKDLSFNPGGVGSVTGWNGVDLVSCAAIADPDAQNLAKEALGRWYMIDSQADGTQTISDGTVNFVPGEITVTDASQLLPLEDTLVESTTNIYGQPVAKDAFLSGVCIDDFSAGATGQNTAAFTRLDKLDFELDKKNGIVKCRKSVTSKYDPVLKFTTGSPPITTEFAELYLTTSYAIHPSTTLVKKRYIKDRLLGGTGVDVVKNNSMARTLTCDYTSGTSTIVTITDNKTDVDDIANVILDNAQNDYQSSTSNVVLYRGIYQFATDGVNLQIQWTCAARSTVPFSTLVSQYAESIPLIPTANQRATARRSRLRGKRTP